MALLHDIGRSTGGPHVADVRHVLDGYRSMLERGFDDSARICLTHSFPIKQTDAFAGPWDCPGEEKQFVQDYLDRTEYTGYGQYVSPSPVIRRRVRGTGLPLRWADALERTKLRRAVARLSQFLRAARRRAAACLRPNGGCLSGGHGRP
jgi:hypothetical protein